MLPGEEKTRKISKKLKVPDWWLGYYAMEYLECRHYFQGNEIWSFDFNLVNFSQLTEIPSVCVIIPASCILFHRVDRNTLSETMSKRMVGMEAAPLSPDVMVEGKADEDKFLMIFNAPEVWDPKLGFSDHCIVLENYNIYQWKIAHFEPIPGENRGWHKSEIPELSPELLSKLKIINDKIYDLRDKRSQDKNADINDLRNKAREYYEELETARRPIRESLLNYHKRKVTNDINQ